MDKKNPGDTKTLEKPISHINCQIGPGRSVVSFSSCLYHPEKKQTKKQKGLWPNGKQLALPKAETF